MLGDQEIEIFVKISLGRSFQHLGSGKGVKVNYSSSPPPLPRK
jgi:hypothetical protein